jgi:hypothetical protein
VLLYEEQHDALKIAAAYRKVSMATILREALQEWLQRNRDRKK